MKYNTCFSIHSVQEEKFKIIKDEVLKPLYDYTKKKEEARKSSALDELIVDGMDAEQIWQQLEIQVGFSDPRISQKFLKSLFFRTRNPSRDPWKAHQSG